MLVKDITIDLAGKQIHYDYKQPLTIPFKHNNEMLAYVAIIAGLKIADLDHVKQSYALITSGVAKDGGDWMTFHEMEEYHSTTRQTIYAWIKRYKLATRTHSGQVVINNNHAAPGRYKQKKGAGKWQKDAPVLP